MIPIPFIGPAYQSRSENYSSARTVNFYLEPGKGKAPGLLVGTPGLTTPWVTLTGGGCRGLHVFSEDYLIAVCGTKVFSITTAGVTTQIGSVSDDGRPARIVGNGLTAVIASNGVLYSVTPTGTSEAYMRSNVSAVDFANGYYVYSIQNSQQFGISGYLDTTIDLAEIQEDGFNPDHIISIIVARGQLFIFSRTSLNIWYYSGNLDFPFDIIDGSFSQVGIAAKDSLVQLDQPFWLGSSDAGAGAVWTMQGGSPKRISTPAIEFAIHQWPDISDAEAFGYSQEGHTFYVLSSQSGNETWVYDVSTEEWHQRAWLHSSGGLYRVRPRCHAYFAGRHLVGDWENGNVYEYSLDTYTDNGNAIPRIRSCVALQQGFANQPTSSFRLDMDCGTGLPSGQGSDPQAMLRTSRDGGRTWTNSLWRSFGKIGEYSRRAIWRRVGGGERTVYEVTISDPVKCNITGAYLE